MYLYSVREYVLCIQDMFSQTKCNQDAEYLHLDKANYEHTGIGLCHIEI